MEIKPSYWRRINPIFFALALAVIGGVAIHLVWDIGQSLPLVIAGLFCLNFGSLFGLKALLNRFGEKGPGKKFVAEVVILHWRGETPRFWAVYKYEWLAEFAAQYMAYVLDHLGNVHWEFGIQFRVYDAEKRKAAEAQSDLDAETPQPA